MLQSLLQVNVERKKMLDKFDGYLQLKVKYQKITYPNGERKNVDI